MNIHEKRRCIHGFTRKINNIINHNMNSCKYYLRELKYRSAPGKRPLLDKRPCNCVGCSNGKCPLLGKRPGNMSQNRSDDEADENNYEDDGDADNLDPFSDSDEYM